MRKFCHMAASASLVLSPGSLTTMNLQSWVFPALGAQVAASKISRRSSSGIGSGLNFRMERRPFTICNRFSTATSFQVGNLYT